jgi:hypothetical protein
MWAISDATDRILEFWLQILNLHKKLVLVTYIMSYYGMVSVVPFLVIIIVFAPARTADQIWWCPLQIPHPCGFLHLLTYKSLHVEQRVRSPPNNMHYLNLLFKQWCPDHIQNTVVENWCLDHTHTIYCGTGLHFHHCGWVCIGNWCWMHTHMYQFPKFTKLC